MPASEIVKERSMQRMGPRCYRAFLESLPYAVARQYEQSVRKTGFALGNEVIKNTNQLCL